MLGSMRKSDKEDAKVLIKAIVQFLIKMKKMAESNDLIFR